MSLLAKPATDRAAGNRGCLYLHPDRLADHRTTVPDSHTPADGQRDAYADGIASPSPDIYPFVHAAAHPSHGHAGAHSDTDALDDGPARGFAAAGPLRLAAPGG
jgi:hypothetical protein